MGDVRHVGVAMRQDVVVTASPPVAGAARPAPGAVLDAVLERVTYANEETGYTIARVATDRSGTDLLTVVGSLLGVQPGESLRLVGRWGSHPKYGRQFEVHSFTTVLPATVQGIERYLGSGLIKGIGPKMAARIVAHFGADTLRIIEDEPARLVEVPGLGPKRTAMIAAAWAEQKAIKEVMIFLQGVGVSTSLAVRIYKKYGDASVPVVRHEPYRLAADVWGIGFKTADTIATSVGIAPDSPERIKAGLACTLSEAADDGHCYLPAPNLLTPAAKILDVPADLIAPCLDELAAAEGVVRDQVPAAARPAAAEAAPQVPAVYLPPFYQAERSLARALLRLHAARTDRLSGFAAVDWDKALGWLRARTGSELAPEQADAVRLALTAKVAVLTGGPGCGKSFTVRSVVELARAKGATIVLAAPTGRAAKRRNVCTSTWKPTTWKPKSACLKPSAPPAGITRPNAALTSGSCTTRGATNSASCSRSSPNSWLGKSPGITDPCPADQRFPASDKNITRAAGTVPPSGSRSAEPSLLAYRATSAPQAGSAVRH